MSKRNQKNFRDTSNPSVPVTNCPAVSVVIPLYNAEKYIGECLDSILAQTFQNFEVIVVDDCSTDSSCSIVESYAEKFGGRLTLSHMDRNTGSGALPRNKGMMLSRGEYIQFLDADDMLTKTALEEMYTLAKGYAADVIYCEKHHEMDADGSNLRVGTRQKGSFVDKPTFETENLAERMNLIMESRISVCTCFKFIQRNLMVENEIFFPHICPSEDDVLTFGLVFYAKKFLRVPNAVYVRRHSEGSVMRKERTPQQTINFWSNPILLGLKALDKMIGKHEFFKKNPHYRYALLEKFVNGKFNCMLRDSFQLPPFVVYETIRKKFGDKLGEQDVLVAALCTSLNTQQKINAVNNQKFQQFAAQVQAQFKQFDQFAHQAQARIAQLEAELKRLQSQPQ